MDELQFSPSALAWQIAERQPGWLTRLDAELFHALLIAQVSVCTVRGMLEIGVYAGKSASILALTAADGEVVYLCDPLSETVHTPLDHALPSLDVTARWLQEQAPKAQIVSVPEPSSALAAILGESPSSLRAIHVDGDHSATAVTADLQYCSRRAAAKGGLIVVDDIRTAHTPGVAASFWPWIAGMDQPRSLVLSEYKAYVLLGTEWDEVVSELPASLRHGRRASSEDLGFCRADRYARVEGA